MNQSPHLASAQRAKPALSLRKRIVFAALAVALGLAIAGLLAELICRAVYGDRQKNLTLDYAPRGSVIYQPEIGWRYRPGYHGVWRYVEYQFDVAINALGLRDDPFQPGPLPRVLFIGDSFTFGVGVEHAQTFVERAALRTAGHPDWDAINASRVGAGSDVYLWFARQFVPVVRPQAVIVCLFLENDYDDTRTFQQGIIGQFSQAEGRVLFNGRPFDQQPQPHQGPLFAHSALYRFLRLGLTRLSINHSDTLFATGWLDPYLGAEPAWVKAAKAQTFQNLLQIRTLAADHGAAFGVVLIPSNLDVNPALFQTAIHRSPHPAIAYDADKPYRDITAFFAAQSIPFCDLRPSFAQPALPTHFKHDRHFTPYGHEQAAQSIHPFVQTILKQPNPTP